MKRKKFKSLPLHLVMSVGTGDNLDECLEVALGCAKSHPLVGRIVVRFNDIRFDIDRNSDLKCETERYERELKSRMQMRRP